MSKTYVQPIRSENFWRSTNRERVILPSSQAKLRKNALLIDQSVFSNFALCVITYINNMGVRTIQCNQLTRKLWLWCIERNLWITATHIPGKLNVLRVIKQIGLPLRGRLNLLTTRMITDQIGLHSVLLPL